MSRTTFSDKSYAKLIVTSLLLIGVGTLIIMQGFDLYQSSSPPSSSSSLEKMNEKLMETLGQFEEKIQALEVQHQKEEEEDEMGMSVDGGREEETGEECDVVIVGGGTGGLISAYRLAPLLGRGLCLFDERERVGGKSQSIREVYGRGASNQRPVWATTQQDSLRGGDVLMRCLAHELGSVMMTHDSSDSSTKFLFTSDSGRNITVDEKILVDSEPGWHESFREYSTRLLGEEGARNFRNLWGSWRVEKYDARWVMDFLKHDSEGVTGRHQRYFHNGVQIGLWQRVEEKLKEYGVRIHTSSRVTSLERVSTLRYELSVRGMSTDRVTAKRIILAVPLAQLGDIRGSVVDKLRQSVFVRGTAPRSVCSFSAFFSKKWWVSEGGAERGWNIFTNPSTHGLFSVHYRDTPEWREGNLLRFEWEEDSCLEMDKLFRETGLVGVKNVIMTRLRSLLPNSTIEDPLQVHFSREDSIGNGLMPGANFSHKSMEQWAVKPLAEEALCLATGSVVVNDADWMEAGARAVHNCLKGPLFLLPQGGGGGGEKCIHRGKTLSLLVKESWRDNCLLLKHEYHLKDLANLSYCSGPNQFPYPSIHTLYSPLPKDPLRIPIPLPIYENSPPYNGYTASS